MMAFRLHRHAAIGFLGREGGFDTLFAYTSDTVESEDCTVEAHCGLRGQ